MAKGFPDDSTRTILDIISASASPGQSTAGKSNMIQLGFA
jgi:hypothetical protein